LPLLVTGVALGLGIAGWRALKTAARGTATARAVPDGVVEREALLHRLARLDAEYAGRESEVPPEEWSRYVAERARLKRELEAALAAGQAPL
jgi:hypothetical protein